VAVSTGLDLRLVEARDAPALFALTDKNRDRLREWLPWLDVTNTVADTLSFIAAQQNAHEKTGAGAMGIWAGETLAGVAGFNTVDLTNRIATIGYWLGERHTGHGMMTRVCRALTNYAIDTLDVNRVVIACATGNARSRAIPLRLGFLHEGTLRDAEWLYDHFVDHDIYAMLAPDWLRMRHGGNKGETS
jgi:ribosomal-protein-serine acetyltransferase